MVWSLQILKQLNREAEEKFIKEKEVSNATVSKMTFSEWADFVNGFTGDRPQELRLGQWAFGILSEAYPEVAKEIQPLDCNPFYQDEKIPAFLCKMLTNFVEMDDPSKTCNKNDN